MLGYENKNVINKNKSIEKDTETKSHSRKILCTLSGELFETYKIVMCKFFALRVIVWLEYSTSG